MRVEQGAFFPQLRHRAPEQYDAVLAVWHLTQDPFASGQS